MTGNQQIQENQYEVPYHWFMSPDEYRGRKYFGYLTLAYEKAKVHGLKEGARVLDAGCGDGRFLRFLSERGMFPEGMDYSERAISFAKILLPHIPIHVGDFTKGETLTPLGEYDAVFLIETLEHINPEEVFVTLSNLTKLVSENGVFVVTVPSSLLPLHDKHYQHFTEASLREVLSPHLNIVEISGYASQKHSLLNTLYKLFDNRFWTIKLLARWFNIAVWPRYLNACKPEEGEGLLAVCRLS